MEELRSTEILDREIQDDARRKAEKILKACEQECAQIEEALTSRIAAIRAGKEAEYKERLVAHRRDVESAIPLEKQRRLVTFIDSSVNQALDAWFMSIGDDKRLSLLAGLVSRYRGVLADRSIRVTYSGFEAAPVRSVLEKLFDKNKIESIAPVALSKAERSDLATGIHVESSDRSIVCRATVAEIRADLLSTCRQEMAEALFGGRMPE